MAIVSTPFLERGCGAVFAQALDECNRAVRAGLGCLHKSGSGNKIHRRFKESKLKIKK
jgi:hypothetical protein